MTEMTHSLYCLTSPSGKKYYGISKRFDRRMLEHQASAKGGESYAISKAIRKYGWEAFSKEIICTGVPGAIKQLEISAIATDGTLAPNGYNLTAGGDGTTAYKFSEEECARRSIWAKENCSEQIKAVGKSRTGLTVSSETRAKQSAAAKKRSLAAVLARVAKMHNEESRQKHLEWLESPEGVKHRLETSARMRVLMRERENATAGTKWVNKEGRNKRVASDLVEMFLADGWRLGSHRAKTNH